MQVNETGMSNSKSRPATRLGLVPYLRPGFAAIVGTGAAVLMLGATLAPAWAHDFPTKLNRLILVLTALVVASGPTLFPKLAFNPQKDLTPIVQLSQSPNAVLVHAASSAKTLNDLIDQARANPGKPNYASSGIGSPLHLAAELLKNVTKTNFVHVAYKGGVPALGRCWAAKCR